MICRIMSGSPFSLTMVAFRTPFILSALHCHLNDGCVTLVTIRLVSFSWTDVSPTLTRLHSVLPFAIHFPIELLLEIVFAFESLIICQSVGLHLC